MKLTRDKHYINHNLNVYYNEIKSFSKKKAFLNSPFYASHHQELNEVINGLEWDNTLSEKYPDKEKLRVVSWNIERGKQLDYLIDYFKEDTELDKADVVLVIETDNGMGRTKNKNVAEELAEALKFNYCFSPSYLVLGKGAIGETEHSDQNTLALHGTAILSKYPIQFAEGIEVPPVKEVFHSSEKRLGCKKGLVAQIEVNNKTISFGAIHIDLSSTAQDRADQLAAVINALPESDIQIVGGDWNCGTFNLRRKWEIITQSFSKLVTIGFAGAIEHYMTPELKFEKPLFNLLTEKGFEYNTYNDRTKGTLYFDMNDMLTNEKTAKFIPNFLVKELERRLRPWNGCVPLKIDWLAGKGAKATNAQTLEKPQINNTRLSDHNPIYVDIEL
jgi:endonuclease/exonuclease/phosphatase family metal-dependent hydrolase